MVVKGLHDLFHRPNDELVFCLTIWIDDELQFTPFGLDFIHLALNLFLSSSSGRYFFDCVLFLHDAKWQQLIQADHFATDHGLFQLIVNLFPVLIFQVWIRHWVDNGHQTNDVLNSASMGFQYLVLTVFWQVANSDVQLDCCQLKGLYLSIDLLSVEVSNVRLLQWFLKSDELAHMGPQ